MKIPSSSFIICLKCNPPHVENCEKCFGFGLYKGAPIHAAEVDNIIKCKLDFEVCPECFGDPINEYVLMMWGDPTSENIVGVSKA